MIAPSKIFGRTYIVLLVLGFSATFALQSCTSNNFQDLQDNGPCFQEEVLPIMVANCAQSGCHSALDRQDGYDFSTYEGILRGIKKGRSADSKIIQSMLGEEDLMPPAPLDPLTADQIAVIAEWIDNGAFNNTGCEAENCDSLSSVSYSQDVKPIIDLHCKGCHNINNPSGGYEFENWEQTNGAATTGALLGSLNGDPAFIQMPWNAPPLSPCKVKTIQVWIEEGALDN
jgi:uncharacterized membrane protein